MERKVTEQDFRMPEFRDAKPEDYEFRNDGKIVRKDRWEQGIRDIACLFSTSREFEIDKIISSVKNLVYVKRLFIKTAHLIDDIEINTAGEVDAIKALKQFIKDTAEFHKDVVQEAGDE
jgi:hypothetical protein